MDINHNVSGIVKELRPDDPLPIDLLLLADETVEIINTYISFCRVYVFASQGKTLGVYALCALSPETVEIKNIAVHEHFQGLGIGTLLLQDSIKRARAEGYKEILIGTGDVMFMQLHFYQKIGFEMYTIKENHYQQSGYPQPLLENGLQLKHMVMLRMSLL